MKKLIVIRGPLGVGKSTVAHAVAEFVHGDYISVDQVIEEHGLDKAEEGAGIPAQNFIAGNTIMLEMAGAGASGIHVIDGNFYHQNALEDLVGRFKGEVKVFTLKASVETCICRDAARSHSYGADAARAVHGMVSSFDAGTIIQTDGKSKDEVVSEIVTSL